MPRVKSRNAHRRRVLKMPHVKSRTASSHAEPRMGEQSSTIPGHPRSLRGTRSSLPISSPEENARAVNTHTHTVPSSRCRAIPEGEGREAGRSSALARIAPTPPFSQGRGERWALAGAAGVQARPRARAKVGTERRMSGAQASTDRKGVITAETESGEQTHAASLLSTPSPRHSALAPSKLPHLCVCVCVHAPSLAPPKPMSAKSDHLSFSNSGAASAGGTSGICIPGAPSGITISPRSWPIERGRCAVQDALGAALGACGGHQKTQWAPESHGGSSCRLPRGFGESKCVCACACTSVGGGVPNLRMLPSFSNSLANM